MGLLIYLKSVGDYSFFRPLIVKAWFVPRPVDGVMNCFKVNTEALLESYNQELFGRIHPNTFFKSGFVDAYDF